MDVQVTNGNDFTLKGRYAGQDYIFPPHESVSIPEKAAEHIFALGFEAKERTGALNRLGLLMPNDPDRTLEKANAAIDNMSFVTGRMVFGESEPLPPPSGIGDSPGAPRSPGGESVAGTSSPVSAADALAQEVLSARKRKAGG